MYPNVLGILYLEYFLFFSANNPRVLGPLLSNPECNEDIEKSSQTLLCFVPQQRAFPTLLRKFFHIRHRKA